MTAAPPGASAAGDGGSTVDAAALAVRALVLYGLAEVQSGNATTLWISASGHSFSVRDDGRGHAIDRQVGAAPYLRFVYTHLDYPFGLPDGGPVQLQGIGMSLVNALCSELVVTVRKRDATHRLTFRDGVLADSEFVSVQSSSTGNAIAGKVDQRRHPHAIDDAALEAWLMQVLASNAALRIVFNDRELVARV